MLCDTNIDYYRHCLTYTTNSIVEKYKEISSYTGYVGIFRTPHMLRVGSQAYLPWGMWDLPGPGIKPMTPALAGRFLTTGPPGKFHPVPFISMSG